MNKYEAINILLFIKGLLDTTAAKQEIRKQLEIASDEWKMDEKKLIRIYEKMVLFSEEIEVIGGMEKYQLSNISWLKTELELLVECCHFCKGDAMRLVDIFYQISNEEASILPKTPSQITYIYYQITKHNQPMERVLRKKVGRKKRTDKDIVAMNQKKLVEEEEEEASPLLKTEYSESGFMKLLSGTMNNLALIYQNQENTNSSLFHLIEEVYHLSSIGGRSSERTKEFEKAKLEAEILRRQQETLTNEKEKMVQDFRTLVDCVQQFIDSPEMTQIITLPKFINDSREVLEELDSKISTEKSQ